MAEEHPAQGLKGRRLPRRVSRAAPVAGGAALALGAVVVYGLLFPAPAPLTKDDVKASISDALASMTPAPAYSEFVYQAVRPSLVLVETHVAQPTEDGKPQDGLGSGVIINQAGDILTSLHVVADASTIHLTFADGTKSPGDVVADDPANDIAVLRPSQLPAEVVPATLGDPSSVHEGSEAYALGSPFGLASSISAGVISATDRTFKLKDSGTVLHGLFQIDAAVNPGNSGGPLVDREGHVIGIVTALLNPTGEDVFIGVGLAVPINVAGGAAGLPPI
jgi:S1-C subfamily serine protease